MAFVNMASFTRKLITMILTSISRSITRISVIKSLSWIVIIRTSISGTYINKKSIYRESINRTSITMIIINCTVTTSECITKISISRISVTWRYGEGFGTVFSTRRDIIRYIDQIVDIY